MGTMDITDIYTLLNRKTSVDNVTYLVNKLHYQHATAECMRPLMIPAVYYTSTQSKRVTLKITEIVTNKLRIVTAQSNATKHTCFWSQALLCSVTLTCRYSRDTKCSARAEEKLADDRSELRLQIAQNDITQIWVVLRRMNLKLNTKMACVQLTAYSTTKWMLMWPPSSSDFHTETSCKGVPTLCIFEPTRVKTQLSPYVPCQPAQLTANAFNWLGRHASSVGSRAYCYITCCFFPAVVMTIASTYFHQPMTGWPSWVGLGG